MKKVLYSMLAFMLVLPLAFGLVACGNNEPEIAGVESAEEFLEAFATESSVALGANITLEEKLDIDKDIEINLNGKTLTFAGTNQYLIDVAEDKNVTIKNGTIDYTSSVVIQVIKSLINNHGNLVLKNINLQANNIDANGPDNINAVGNNGEGILTLQNSIITINTKEDTTNDFKPIGVWNLGRTFTVTNTVINVSTTTVGSSYGVYNYINEGEVDPGTRTVTISGTTINFTSSVINTACGVFAESYVEGEDNKAVITIGANTVVNVTRTAESGSGKKTYGLRAKGNAVITGANNATITLTDNTECTQLERGPETTGVIED